MLILPLLLLAVVLFAAACGDDADTAPAQTGDGDPLGDTEWVLTAAEVDGTSLELLDTHPVTLMRTDDGIGGTAACNNYGGDITIDGSTVTVGDLFQTEMACDPPAAMELESAYTAALARVDTATADGAGLTLSGDGVTLTFAARAPEPDAALTGTTWTLDTIIENEAASTPVAGTDATMTIDDANQVTGNTGCNSFMGEIEVGDDAFEPAALASTRMACQPDVMAQEAAVLRVLSEGPSWSIEGPLLTLTLDDGTGLIFRAG
ncbi:MAG: META domain-containing protein [Acidimicrobiales bacterium]